jgi:hypothetical protein
MRKTDAELKKELQRLVDNPDKYFDHILIFAEVLIRLFEKVEEL